MPVSIDISHSSSKKNFFEIPVGEYFFDDLCKKIYKKLSQGDSSNALRLQNLEITAVDTQSSYVHVKDISICIKFST